MHREVKLQRIDNKFRGRNYEVECGVCRIYMPFFHDIATRFRGNNYRLYSPQDYLVELKSLKLYLNSYRDKGILHEEAVNCILDDFVKTIAPLRVENHSATLMLGEASTRR